MESEPAILKRINDDGSVTIAGPPENQKDSIIKGLPHLVVKPSRFKKSGNFIEAEVEGDYINAIVKYEVKNVGDVTAVITEDGFKPIVEIEPEDIKYYKNTLKIARGPNNNKSLQDFITLLDAEKEALMITLNLLYRPKNNDRMLLKVTTINEFRKNKVREVKVQ